MFQVTAEYCFLSLLYKLVLFYLKQLFLVEWCNMLISVIYFIDIFQQNKQ